MGILRVGECPQGAALGGPLIGLAGHRCRGAFVACWIYARLRRHCFGAGLCGDTGGYRGCREKQGRNVPSSFACVLQGVAPSLETAGH